jgi:hypothetical protein
MSSVCAPHEASVSSNGGVGHRRWRLSGSTAAVVDVDDVIARWWPAGRAARGEAEGERRGTAEVRMAGSVARRAGHRGWT